MLKSQLTCQSVHLGWSKFARGSKLLFRGQLCRSGNTFLKRFGSASSYFPAKIAKIGPNFREPSWRRTTNECWRWAAESWVRTTHAENRNENFVKKGKSARNNFTDVRVCIYRVVFCSAARRAVRFFGLNLSFKRVFFSRPVEALKQTLPMMHHRTVKFTHF